MPKRLLVRPLDHSEIERNSSDINLGTEARRWFDYWLKDVHNGIMDEPPIHYYVTGARRIRLGASADSGRLKVAIRLVTISARKSRRAPPVACLGWKLRRALRTSPSARSITRRRQANVPAGPPLTGRALLRYAYERRKGGHSYVLAADDGLDDYGTSHRASLGRPEVPDLDVFVYLEEVDRNGKSTYLTEGNLRASHRRVSAAPLGMILGCPTVLMLDAI